MIIYITFTSTDNELVRYRLRCDQIEKTMNENPSIDGYYSITKNHPGGSGFRDITEGE